MTAWTPHTHHALLTRTVAAHGLAGSTLTFPDQPLEQEQFESLLGSVRSQRLTGMLWHAALDGALPVTEIQAERIELAHQQALAGVLVLERLLLETVEVLEDAFVEVRVLKGPALAHLDFPDPSWRTFGDIDLLVRSFDFDRAVAIIGGQGHRRRHPEPRPGFDRRFSKGTSFATADGLEIDLHRTFTMGPYGVRLDVPALWNASQRFTLAGRVIQTLPIEERFVHACYHAALGEARPRLVPLRDAVQLALSDSLDLARVHDLVRASGGGAVVSRAVRHAWHALQVADVLAITAWAKAYRVDPKEAADLAVYGSGSSYARKSLASVRALPTLRERVAFLHALLDPQGAYLGDRHAGRVGRLRKGLAQAVRRHP